MPFLVPTAPRSSSSFIKSKSATSMANSMPSQVGRQERFIAIENGTLEQIGSTESFAFSGGQTKLFLTDGTHQRSRGR
jgi:hypothetical protein